MAGFPVRVDKEKLGAAANRLDQSITVKKLQNTTVGEILQALVEAAGLTYAIEPGGIRIEAARSDDAGDES